jgi:hypothetical protein
MRIVEMGYYKKTFFVIKYFSIFLIILVGVMQIAPTEGDVGAHPGSFDGSRSLLQGSAPLSSPFYSPAGTLEGGSQVLYVPDVRQRAITHALEGFSEVKRFKGELRSAEESDVPHLPPDFGGKFIESAREALTDPRSLMWILTKSNVPSITGTGKNSLSSPLDNPWIAHTLGAHGSLDAGLQSSRELDLAIKVAKEKELSISPARLFDIALDVTNGDEQSALLTCHNLLKEITYAQPERSKEGVQILLMVPVSPKTSDFYKEAYQDYFTKEGLKNFLVSIYNGNLEITLP